MKRLTFFLGFLALFANAALANDRISATLFKNPGCKCCDGHADYLRANGFNVTVVEAWNMTLIKRKYSVPKNLEGCHTTVVGDYVVEGHVPAAPIKRLLGEKPLIKGISLPGMPEGSPGMSGTKQGPFNIHAITGEIGAAPIYATE